MYDKILKFTIFLVVLLFTLIGIILVLAEPLNSDNIALLIITKVVGFAMTGFFGKVLFMILEDYGLLDKE